MAEPRIDVRNGLASDAEQVSALYWLKHGHKPIVMFCHLLPIGRDHSKIGIASKV